MQLIQWGVRKRISSDRAFLQSMTYLQQLLKGWKKMMTNYKPSYLANNSKRTTKILEMMNQREMELTQEQDQSQQLTRIGLMAREHWKKYRPNMYRQLEEAGQLTQTLLQAQQSTEEALERVKEQLLELHPVEDSMGVEGKRAHFIWIDQTAWEMVREMILLPTEEDVPNLNLQYPME
ncbi:TnpV protein [Brevibacillus centrosporus]|uniref:TnpV protein n=1 Tax=Brevibacillus centrosporus TaxID=54910 RepID=UPI003D21E3DE